MYKMYMNWNVGLHLKWNVNWNLNWNAYVIWIEIELKCNVIWIEMLEKLV